MTPPKVYIGSSTWCDKTPKEVVEKYIPVLQELGVKEIDTAPIYPVLSPGETEKLLGELGFVSNGFLVDSKVLYFGDGSGTLTADAIQRSLDSSLANIKTGKLNVLYCHGPDKTTPIADQAAAMDAQYRAGKFTKLGVSNFPPSMLEEWLQVASEQGYIKPSVFQGQYNLLCRASESTLFPLLRKHNITFVAFSPLAGGVLTGKLTFSKSPEDLKGTRFEASPTNFAAMVYGKWYDKPTMHAAVRKMNEACKSFGVDMSDAACRWLMHHSALDGGPLLDREKGDGVIIGPRSLEQLERYAEAYKNGPLPEGLVSILDGLWEDVREDGETIVVY